MTRTAGVVTLSVATAVVAYPVLLWLASLAMVVVIGGALALAAVGEAWLAAVGVLS